MTAPAGAGFDHRHYVPVILSKRGERRAVANLAQTIKNEMTPLFVIPPVEWDYEADAPAKSIDDHLANQPRELRAAWGTRRALVDLTFADDGPLSSGVHPLVALTDAANGLGLPLVPTTGIDRTPAYLQAVVDVVARDGRGVCLRLLPAEWPVGTRRLTELNTTLTDLAVSPTETDLVLDLGADVAASPALTLTAVSAELAALPYASDWRSITVTLAAFPKGAGDFAKGMNYLDRADWQLYQALIALVGTTGRLPTFGDYVVAHPDPFVDVDPRMMQNSATLRYTGDNEWLFPKGEHSEVAEQADSVRQPSRRLRRSSQPTLDFSERPIARPTSGSSMSLLESNRVPTQRHGDDAELNITFSSLPSNSPLFPGPEPVPDDRLQLSHGHFGGQPLAEHTTWLRTQTVHQIPHSQLGKQLIPPKEPYQSLRLDFVVDRSSSFVHENDAGILSVRRDHRPPVRHSFQGACEV